MAIATPRRAEAARLADTQASLRPAGHAGRAANRPVLFAAVTKEFSGNFGGGTARMIRYEPDGTATLLANAGTESTCGSASAWKATRRPG